MKLCQYNRSAVELITSVILYSTMLQEDCEPNWYQLTAPSGAGKSLLFSLFDGHPAVYWVNDLTSKSFMSGYADGEAEDVSLMPHLKNKTVLIEDFSSVSAKGSDEAKAFFSAARSAHSGHFVRHTGTGRTEAKGRFNYFAATTPDIDKFLFESHWGQRLLLFRWYFPLKHYIKYNRHVAHSNATRHIWYPKMKTAVLKVLDTLIPKLPKTFGEFAFQPDAGTINTITELSHIVAVCRTNPSVGDLHPGSISTNTPECGTRVSAALLSSIWGLAVMEGRQTVSDRTRDLLLKMGWGSIPAIGQRLLRALYRSGSMLDTPRLARTAYCDMTYTRATLYQFSRGGIVKQGKSLGNGRERWKLTDETRKMLTRTWSDRPWWPHATSGV